LLRVQCGKAKRGAGGGILLPVFILWEPFRYPFTWLPILALRPSTKAPPATTISNPVSISLLFSRIYLFGNPFVFFSFYFFFLVRDSRVAIWGKRRRRKKQKTSTRKKKETGAHDASHSCLFHRCWRALWTVHVFAQVVTSLDNQITHAHTHTHSKKKGIKKKTKQEKGEQTHITNTFSACVCRIYIKHLGRRLYNCYSRKTNKLNFLPCIFFFFFSNKFLISFVLLFWQLLRVTHGGRTGMRLLLLQFHFSLLVWQILTPKGFLLAEWKTREL
jgi:hypothetical protein